MLDEVEQIYIKSSPFVKIDETNESRVKLIRKYKKLEETFRDLSLDLQNEKEEIN